MVRAKFTVTAITNHLYGGTEIEAKPQYDESIPEDQRFQEATPTGELKMFVSNPAALAEFELGKDFYLDFTPVK